MVYVYMYTGMAEGQKLLDVFIALHIVYEARSLSSKLAREFHLYLLSIGIIGGPPHPPGI